MEKEKILLTQIPSGYLSISSGLGEAAPANIIVLPVLFEGQVKGVLELASFERFNPTHQALLDQLTETIGIVLNTIEANTLTEDLLKQSQSSPRSSRVSRRSCGRPTRNSRKKRSSWPNRTSRSNGRTRRSSRRASRSKRRRSSSR
jgi:GAF domain-containing protein